jgi:hypothetical protein
LTGAHADRYTRWKFTEVPGWTWILLPFGFIPFVIARFATARDFEGVLPVSARAERRVRMIAVATVVGGIAGIALLVGGLVAPAWGIAGIVTLACAGLLVLAGFASTPNAKRDVGAATVELTRVHEAFVAALTAVPASPPPS